MERYIVSARKYRPITFESVVGQQSITDTLRNAIRQQHLAQAYLFSGPRGVGKTTCARIFAKTINCLNPTPDHDACNECESCRAFNEQRSFNIHELDAASNNSVENIRSLIDQVRIPPQIGRYSVYIIDEVHMLTKDAFNALLKTLEEPPSYAIFILATTEKHKVIPTILSRCQIYDFSRITITDIVRYLQYVAKNEGVDAPEEALGVVAQKADGGMRDALSIFDQLVAYCGNKVTYEQTIDVLNVLDTDYYFRMVDCALTGDVHQALLLFNNILNKGFDAQNFIVGLGVHLRDVLVSKDPITTQLLECAETTRQHYAEQAAKCSPAFLFKALEIINDCDIQYRTAKNKRLTVEIMIVKLCQLLQPSLLPQQPPVTLQPLNPTRQAPTANKVAPANTQQPVQQPVHQTAQQPAYSSIQHSPTAVQQSNPLPKTMNTGLSFKDAMKGVVRPQPNTQPVQQQTQPTQVIEQPTAKQNNKFSDAEFESVWRDLGRHFGKDEDRLRAALVNGKIEREDNQVTLVLANTMQEQDVRRHKEQLLKLLHQGLRNDYINLNTRVEELKNTGGGTIAERYQHLVTQNHGLEDLRIALDMQLE